MLPYQGKRDSSFIRVYVSFIFDVCWIKVRWTEEEIGLSDRTQISLRIVVSQVCDFCCIFLFLHLCHRVVNAFYLPLPCLWKHWCNIMQSHGLDLSSCYSILMSSSSQGLANKSNQIRTQKSMCFL